MPKDNFQSSSDSVIAPAQFCFDVLPSDSEELQLVTKAIYVGEGGDVTLRAVDHAHQRVARGIGTALVVGNRGEGGGGLDNRFQRQCATGVLEENARPGEGARLHVGEAVADGGHEGGVGIERAQCGFSCRSAARAAWSMASSTSSGSVEGTA